MDNQQSWRPHRLGCRGAVSLSGIVTFLLVWSLLGAAGLMFLATEQAKRHRLETACRYFTVNGTPKSVVIEGTEYKLTPDGKIDPIDRVFLNPWHEELLRGMTDDDCVFVDTEGGAP